MYAKRKKNPETYESKHAGNFKIHKMTYIVSVNMSMKTDFSAVIFSVENGTILYWRDIVFFIEIVKRN